MMPRFLYNVMTAAIAAVVFCVPAQAQEPCAGTEAQAIEAAIADVVRMGLQEQQFIDRGECPPGAREPCVNSYPYFTVEQFRAENPDCCHLMKSMPGDFVPQWAPYVDGRALPRLFLVDIRYLRYRVNPSGKPYSVKSQLYQVVSCSMQIVRGYPDYPDQ